MDRPGGVADPALERGEAVTAGCLDQHAAMAQNRVGGCPPLGHTGLERHAGALLVDSLTDEMASKLRAQVAFLHRLAEDGDGERQIEEDLKFHRMICVFAGNRRLLKVFDELTAETRFGIAMIGRLYDDPHQIARTHEPLLDALVARDAGVFAAASDYHIGTARERVVAMFSADGAPRRGDPSSE